MTELGVPDHKRRVLLVDDQATFRALLRVTLEVDGRFEVVGEACDGAEAIAAFETLEPDLVVMDVDMPGMNGLEATALLASRTRVVILSGMERASTEPLAVAAGAAAVLNKQLVGVGDLAAHLLAA